MQNNEAQGEALLTVLDKYTAPELRQARKATAGLLSSLETLIERVDDGSLLIFNEACEPDVEKARVVLGEATLYASLVSARALPSDGRAVNRPLAAGASEEASLLPVIDGSTPTNVCNRRFTSGDLEEIVQTWTKSIYPQAVGIGLARNVMEAREQVAELAKARSTLIDRAMQASGFAGLLAEVLGSNAQLGTDLRERVQRAVSDNEAHLASALARNA